MGVYLTDLRPDDQIQMSLFDVKGGANRVKLAKASTAIDKLNLLMGKNKVQFASMGFDQNGR